MDTELVKQIDQATKLIEKLYGESDHLKWAYLRYANTKEQLETTNKKSLYTAVMTILLLSGLVSNLRLLLRFSRSLWLGLLGGIVVAGIFIGFYSSKFWKKRSEIKLEHAKEDYELAVKPFLDQIQGSQELKLIPPQYQFPIAANYILNALQDGTASIEDATQKFEAYFDDLADQSNHEEFRKTKEQASGVSMFYPDLELAERVERASKVSK